MNEVALHRGRHPHLTVVDAFFNDQHLTEAVVGSVTTSVLTPGRWIATINAYRIDSLLALSGWPHCPPSAGLLPANSYCTSKSELPYAHATWFWSSRTQGAVKDPYIELTSDLCPRESAF
jgi:hypothetical protein